PWHFLHRCARGLDMQTTTEEAAPHWGEPLRGPGPLRGLWVIFRLATRQLLLSRRTLIFIGISTLPILLTIAAIVTRRLHGLGPPADELYEGLYTFLYAQLLVLLVPMLYATSLIGDEVEGKTITCLTTRPVSK